MIQNPFSFLQTLDSVHTQIALHTVRIHLREGGFFASEKTIPNHMMVMVETGELNVRSQNQHYVLRAGDVLWLPVGSEKHFECLPNRGVLKQWNLRFNVTHGQQEVAWCSPEPHRRGAWEIMSLMQLLQQMLTNDHPYETIRIRALMVLCITSFLSLDVASSEILGFDPVLQQRIENVIHEKLHEGLRVGELASEVGLTTDYFSRMFGKTYGIPPREYLVKQRIHNAVNLLRDTNLSVAQIAHAVGLENVSLFCRQFRSIMGQTPHRYRNNLPPTLIKL